MAPRRRGLATTVLRAVTTTLAVLISLLSDAAAASRLTPSPSPAPAPAPLITAPPPELPATGRHREARGGPRAAPPAESPSSSGSWWRRLNLGQIVGLALVGVALAMQVVFVAFLAARARQLSRQAPRARPWERESPARYSIGGL